MKHLILEKGPIQLFLSLTTFLTITGQVKPQCTYMLITAVAKTKIST